MTRATIVKEDDEDREQMSEGSSISGGQKAATTRPAVRSQNVSVISLSLSPHPPLFHLCSTPTPGHVVGYSSSPHPPPGARAMYSRTAWSYVTCIQPDPTHTSSVLVVLEHCYTTGAACLLWVVPVPPHHQRSGALHTNNSIGNKVPGGAEEREHSAGILSLEGGHVHVCTTSLITSLLDRHQSCLTMQPLPADVGVDLATGFPPDSV